jgi:hypothetical protein
MQDTLQWGDSDDDGGNEFVKKILQEKKKPVDVS